MRSVAIILCLLSITITHPTLALAALPAIETCTAFEWDPVPEPALKVLLYVSRTPGQYAFGQSSPPTAGGFVSQVRRETTRIPCSRLRGLSAGTWYAVITAHNANMSPPESEPSNEISFTVGQASPPGDEVPPPAENPPPPTPPSALPAPPPPLTLPPLATTPLKPPSSGGGGRMTDTCVWQGKAGC